MNAKQLAAEQAVKLVKDGMTVGIGTGSTTAFAIEAISNRIKQGLSIKAVASSTRSEELAKKAGIKLISFSELERIDLYIDGADEVDRDLNLIKGGGGALLRERQPHGRQEKSKGLFAFLFYNEMSILKNQLNSKQGQVS